MTITNGYATLAELKARIGIASDDTVGDSQLEAIVEAASRAIDEHCGRRFYADSTAGARYYTAEFSDLLFLPDDVISVTTLATDSDGDRTYEDTWETTDYDLQPDNASTDGRPYTRIQITPAGRYAFPVGVRRGVKLTAVYGWSAAPKPVKEATLIQAGRLWARKDAPFGIMGSAEFGQMQAIPRLDPDVLMLLLPFRRMGVSGI